MIISSLLYNICIYKKKLMRNSEHQINPDFLNEMYQRNRVFLVHNNCRVEQYMKKSYRELYLILYSIKNTNSLKSKIPRLEQELIIDKTIFSKDVSKLIKKYQSFLEKLKLEYGKDYFNEAETQKKEPLMVNSQQFIQPQKIGKTLILDMVNVVEQVRYEKYLQDSIRQLTQLYRFYKEKDSPKIQALFAEHARVMALDMKITVFLPTILKTTLLKINSLDFKNRVADLRLKVKLKIFIPGFTNFPDMYEKMLKKLKIRLRTERNSWQAEDNFVDFSKLTKIYKNLKEYCSQDHRLNDLERKIWLKNYGDQFQGVIISTQIPHVITQVVGDTRTSPFEMFDLRGIIQLLPINTEIQDWQKSIFIQDEGLRKFFFKSSPNILLKLNLISLYKQKIFFNDLTQINHINSKHQVKIQTYQLAGKKMFLQITDNQKSNYSIQRVNKKFYSYDWVFLKTKPEKQENKQLNQALRNTMKKYLNSQIKYKQQIEKHKKIFQKIRSHQKIKRIQSQTQSNMKSKECDILLSKDQYSQEQLSRDIKNIEKQLALLNDYYYPKQKWEQEKLRPRSKIQLENIQRYFYVKVSQQQEEQVLQLLKQKFVTIKKNQSPLLQSKIIFNFQKQVNDKKKQALDQIANLEWQNESIPMSECEYIIDKLSDSQAHFHFPIFNDPGLLILSSFFLIVLQGVSVLFLFFHSDSMIGILVAATQSTFGLIKVVKDLQTDVLKRRFSIFQFVANLILITPILFISDAVFQGYLARQKRVYEDLLFYISVVITAINLIVPSFFYINHQYFQKKKYTDPQILSVPNKKILKYNIMPGSKQINQYFQGPKKSKRRQQQQQKQQQKKEKQQSQSQQWQQGYKILNNNVQARVIECLVDYLKIVHYLRIKIKNSPDYLYESLHKHFNKKINYMNTILGQDEGQEKGQKKIS